MRYARDADKRTRSEVSDGADILLDLSASGGLIVKSRLNLCFIVASSVHLSDPGKYWKIDPASLQGMKYENCREMEYQNEPVEN